jgi:hypothetical protein
MAHPVCDAQGDYMPVRSIIAEVLYLQHFAFPSINKDSVALYSTLQWKSGFGARLPNLKVAQRTEELLARVVLQRATTFRSRRTR